MVKQILQKGWKDPVWSKLISAGILGLLTLPYNFVVSQNKNLSFSEVFISFWTYKIELWIALLIIFTVSFLYLLFKRNFKYSEETLALDRTQFNLIRNWNGMIDFAMEIKTHGFSSRPVKMERIKTMIEIIKESEKPDFFFFNPKLNKLKDNLITELKNLDSTLNGYIFGANNGHVSIPSEWEYQQPERMNEAIKKIKKQEDIFTETFQSFIMQGRKILEI